MLFRIIENDMEIGDRQYISGQNGVKVYDSKPFSYQENHTVVYMLESSYYNFLFNVSKSYTSHTKNFRGI